MTNLMSLPVGVFDLHVRSTRTLAPLPSMKAGNLEYYAVGNCARSSTTSIFLGTKSGMVPIKSDFMR
jgi:hypothetical protein